MHWCTDVLWVRQYTVLLCTRLKWCRYHRRRAVPQFDKLDINITLEITIKLSWMACFDLKRLLCWWKKKRHVKHSDYRLIAYLSPGPLVTEERRSKSSKPLGFSGNLCKNRIKDAKNIAATGLSRKNKRELGFSDNLIWGKRRKEHSGYRLFA